MSQFKPLPPIQELQKAFAYDPATGLFTRKQSRGSSKAGTITGAVNSEGYIQLCYNKRLMKASRVAWLFMTGVDPMERLVEHKDRNPLHNWWNNLRLATSLQNSANRLAKGWARLPNGRYRAHIYVKGKLLTLGAYGTPEEAHEVYKAKHIEIHGSFSPYFQ